MFKKAWKSLRTRSTRLPVVKTTTPGSVSSTAKWANHFWTTQAMTALEAWRGLSHPCLMRPGILQDQVYVLVPNLPHCCRLLKYLVLIRCEWCHWIGQICQECRDPNWAQWTFQGRCGERYPLPDLRRRHRGSRQQMRKILHQVLRGNPYQWRASTHERTRWYLRVSF